MVSEVNQSEPPIRIFRVRFRNGDVWTISAVRFERHLTPEDLVKFYDAGDVENKNYFLRGDDVSALGPDENLEVTPAIVALQENFKRLEDRVGGIEQNLGNIVRSAVSEAVNAAFAARGM